MIGEPTHAGGVVHRERDGRVLLVRARPAPHDWVLPKGHVETGETLEATAIREVREEAGVVASVVRGIGALEYTKPDGKPARVAFFLMRFVEETSPAEERETRWCSVDEAIALVRFANTQAILDAARRAVESP